MCYFFTEMPRFISPNGEKQMALNQSIKTLLFDDPIPLTNDRHVAL